MSTIVIAPDKFKGSLSAIQVCQAIEKGIKKQLPELDIICLPMADGGDGTIEVFKHYLGGKTLTLKVNNPLFKPVQASYLLSATKQTAYIEMSEASGLHLLQENELNPLLTSSYGTGELIAHALDIGVEHIILGIGGSATNDAGLGMARALGYRFYNENSEELIGCGQDLAQLYSIDHSHIHPRLKDVKIEVACDVDNPLFGPNGAAFIYASQKGATPEMVAELDNGLLHFNNIMKKLYKVNLQDIAGSGAAGGLGAGCLLFLNATLLSGIELVMQVAQFDKHIIHADWIISGEGKLDAQTYSGKVVKGVMDACTRQKLALFCGINALNHDFPNAAQPNYISQIITYGKTLDESIRNASLYLEQTAKDFAINHLI